jgi:hydrogenase-1 operon protein HyaE
MCVAIPMRALETWSAGALAAGRGRCERIDTRLVGACDAGDWLLVFQGAAREKLHAGRAAEIDAALDLLEAARRRRPRIRPALGDERRGTRAPGRRTKHFVIRRHAVSAHPLIQRLVAEQDATTLAPEMLDAWAARAGDHVIFLSGDTVRFPEALDLAVVLPELRAAFGERFDIGIVPREAEEAIARRYGVQRWPSLVFVRQGGYVATVSGMQDWSDFCERIGNVLASPVTRAPTIGIPVVASGACADTACH